MEVLQRQVASLAVSHYVPLTMYADCPGTHCVEQTGLDIYLLAFASLVLKSKACTNVPCSSNIFDLSLRKVKMSGGWPEEKPRYQQGALNEGPHLAVTRTCEELLAAQDVPGGVLGAHRKQPRHLITLCSLAALTTPAYSEKKNKQKRNT